VATQHDVSWLRRREGARLVPLRRLPTEGRVVSAQRTETPVPEAGCASHEVWNSGCAACRVARIRREKGAQKRIEFGDVLDLLDAWVAQRTAFTTFEQSYRTDDGAHVTIQIRRERAPAEEGKSQ